jgi:crotonobetainyl-CoA:carnitine CoA-transferase CaiB-like acyl-CoA transferase
LKAGPLGGIRVIEFTHMVMGPSCGMVLGDLGADVIKIEPTPAGDNSRRLTGAAMGFFPTYNRNKRSLCVDLKSQAGLNVARNLISTADVLLENFRPGAMDKLGLGYSDMAALNARLIYCACKGFLPGPYEHRAALDEVVQMMGGLAYMTGPPGQPLRAGASVNDIMGGVFGAVAVLAALRERDASGRGSLVQSGLFETNMAFVGQHMAHAAITGEDLPSYGDPAMGRPWPIYDIFDSDVPDAPVFVGVVTETQWKSFCEAFGLEDFLADPGMQTMTDLTAQRSRIRPRVAMVFRKLSKQELMSRLEALGLPFAPVGKPSDMFSDHHLQASGGLLSTELDTTEIVGGKRAVNQSAGLPALPISLQSGRPGLRRQPPHVGEHSVEIAREAGLSDPEIAEMVSAGTIVSRRPSDMAHN